MSTLTVAALALIAVVILGLIAVIIKEYGAWVGPIETYRMSTCELPNVAPPIGAPDTDPARRNTVRTNSTRR